MSKGCNAHTFTPTSWTNIQYIGAWAIVMTFLGHTFTQTSWTSIPYIMGHRRDISRTRPHHEDFNFLMLHTGQYNQTIRFTTASTDTCCHAGLNGFRKSSLHGLKQGTSILTKIIESLVKGMQCSYFHTTQLDQYPIYRCWGHRRDISWARPHPEYSHFLMLCTRHYNRTIR